MLIVNNVLIGLHLLGLVIGMGSGIALGVMGPLYGQAKDGERSLLFRIGNALGRNGHVGLGLLWVTGILIVFLKYGGIGAMTPWFWAKMVAVVALSASIGIGSAAYRRFQAGDNGASARVALTATINKVLGPVIILLAVFAFN